MIVITETEISFLPPIVGLIGALIGPAISAVGSLLSKRKGNRTEATDTATSTGTATDTTGYGEQGQQLIQTLLPMLQRILQSPNPVNPGDFERIGGIRAQAANQSADSLFQTLQGNAAAQGLTYSAPAGFARGVAESTRSNLLNNIYSDTANNILNARVANDQAQQQRFGLAQNFLNFLPQQNTRTTEGTTTGSAQQTGRTGGVLGDIIQSGGDLLSLYRDNKNQKKVGNSPYLNVSNGGLI